MGSFLRPRAATPDDSGVALIAVLGAFLVVMVLVLGSLGYVAASVRFARLEQDTTAAEAAAQSGIHDFLTRIRLDDAYLDAADPAAAADPTNFCGNPAASGPDVILPLDSAGSPACGWDASTPVGWVAVAEGEPASPRTPSFHYRVVQHDPVRQDLVLEVVGRSRDAYRTLQARLAVPSTSDYLYFSDYEVADPGDVSAYPENPHYPASQQTSAACGGRGLSDPDLRYAWDGSAGGGSAGRRYVPADLVDGQVADCREPAFVRGDVLDGRVHSNDSIRSDGARFLAQVSTADPACAVLDPAGSATWLSCLRTGSSATLDVMPVYEAAPLEMPQTTADLRAVAASGIGCSYAGATRIVLHDDGTMTVWSKQSVSASVNDPAACGRPGTAIGQLGSKAGAVVPVPADGLVYVDDRALPSGASQEIVARGIGGPNGRELPLGDYQGQTPEAGAGGYTSDITFAEPLKHAGYGNLYLEGVARGQVTFAAAGSVVLTGDVVLAGGHDGEDIVGIVAGRSVEVFRPRMSTRYAVPSPFGDSTADSFRWARRPPHTTAVPGWPTRYADPETGAPEPAAGLQVAAAMIALNGSVRVQQWAASPQGGADGTLLVRGSIAQRFRGTVAAQHPTSDAVVAGYHKDYRYDGRLDGALRPPYFPALEGGDGAAWSWRVTWTEEHDTDALVRAS